MQARHHSDVIVVGLGAMGSAACLALSRRGASVVGIDQYAPPHALGSTHGDTRITRLAIGEGAQYAPFVRRSHELWRELEQRAGAQLLTQCGGLVIADAGNEFLLQTRACARRYGVAHEHLANAELRRRFPMFAVDEATEAYYEPEAGYVRPEAAVAAQLRLAGDYGARLAIGERVAAWSASPRGVRVHTDSDTYEARTLVLCGGAWIPELWPEGAGHVAIYRQLLYWFEIRADYERLAGMPIFIWEFEADKSGFVHSLGFYGFPAIDGPLGGLKVATESYERTTKPDGRQHPASAQEAAAMYDRYVAGRLPALGPVPVRTLSCLYTSTRGSRFIIDRHPQHEHVVIISACSGHGFKHSPAIGEAVAQWLLEGVSAIDLAPFKLQPE